MQRQCFKLQAPFIFWNKKGTVLSIYIDPFHVVYDKDRLDLGHCTSQKWCGGLIEIFPSIGRY